jgi:hypothetical protein
MYAAIIIQFGTKHSGTKHWNPDWNKTLIRDGRDTHKKVKNETNLEFKAVVNSGDITMSSKSFKSKKLLTMYCYEFQISNFQYPFNSARYKSMNIITHFLNN